MREAGVDGIKKPNGIALLDLFGASATRNAPSQRVHLPAGALQEGLSYMPVKARLHAWSKHVSDKCRLVWQGQHSQQSHGAAQPSHLDWLPCQKLGSHSLQAHSRAIV